MTEIRNKHTTSRSRGNKAKEIGTRGPLFTAHVCYESSCEELAPVFDEPDAARISHISNILALGRQRFPGVITAGTKRRWPARGQPSHYEDINSSPYRFSATRA